MPALPATNESGGPSAEAGRRRARPIYRVFVSSTWLDLQPERRALMDALNRMEEMRFVGMEFFGNRPDDTRGASIDQVDQCELFVGIIGFRYGSGITAAEYRRARELNLPCFIYLKAGAPAAPGDDEPAAVTKLAEFKQALLRDHTVKEFARPEELAANATADLHNWVAARWISLEPAAGPAQEARAAPATSDRANLLRLVDRVQGDWIEGVLDGSLHRRAWLDLGLDQREDAVDHPWDQILVAPDRPVQTLGRQETIADIFRTAQHTLLVLGEPGAGKTTTLLELARELVRQARSSADEPAPVVLALSTWTGRHATLRDWLLEEMNVRYQVPKRLAGAWLDAARLVLLLDGLDEVREELRPGVVTAINAFALEHMPAGLAVTCRVTEYSALTERLRLRSAICLQPLTPAQIDAYFERAGPGLENLRAAMRTDESLRMLAQTPLMLSVMTMAWRDASTDAVGGGGGVAIGHRRRQLLDAYVQTALRRKGAKHPDEFAQQVASVLPWLARQMRPRGQTLFAVEQMQPDWLDGARWRFAYFFLSRTLAVLLVGLPFWIFLPTLAIKLGLAVAAIVMGLAFALLDLVFFSWLKAQPRVGVYRVGAIAAVFGLAPLLSFALAYSVWFNPYFHELFPSISGLGLVIVVTLAAPLDIGTRDIRPADAVGWSWRKSLRQTGFGVVLYEWFIIIGGAEYAAVKGWSETMHESGAGGAGFWLGVLLGVLLGGLATWRWSWRGWSVLVYVGAMAALGAELTQAAYSREPTLAIPPVIIAGLFALFGGLTSGIDETRTRRTGAWFWVKIPVLAGLVVMVFAVAFISAIALAFGGLKQDWRQIALIMSLVAGGCGLVAFFRFGGLQGLQHFLLRRLLVRSGRLPSDPGEFLDQAARANLLQKVGFGYRFMHALLLDHFADQPAGRR